MLVYYVIFIKILYTFANGCGGLVPLKVQPALARSEDLGPKRWRLDGPVALEERVEEART